MAININIPSQVSQTITDGVTDKAPSENAVFDALAGKKQASIFEITTTGTVVTGTTANMISSSVLVPANTITVGRIYDLGYNAVFTGTSGQKTTRVYVNTSNSLSGATLLATYTAANNVLYSTMSRRIGIKSATLTEVVTATGSLGNGDVATQVPPSQLNIDWTQDHYFLFAEQLANSGDTAALSIAKMTL